MRHVESLTVQRKDRTITIDAASQIDQLKIGDAELILVMSASDNADLKPTELLSAMGLESLLEAGAYIVRTRVELEHTLAPEHCVHKGMNHEERNADQCRSAGREPHRDP